MKIIFGIVLCAMISFGCQKSRENKLASEIKQLVTAYEKEKSEMSINKMETFFNNNLGAKELEQFNYKLSASIEERLFKRVKSADLKTRNAKWTFAYKIGAIIFVYHFSGEIISVSASNSGHGITLIKNKWIKMNGVADFLLYKKGDEIKILVEVYGIWRPIKLKK